MPLEASQRDALLAAAWRVRTRIVDTVYTSGSGHIGAALSQTDLLVALYHRALRFDPAHPDDPDRDRFVLSKGHGGLGLAAVLAEIGALPESDLARFGETGFHLGMHMDRTRVPGVEVSTGSLGHGLGVALGMALGAQHLARGWRTFCLLSDGELYEGSTWEAAMAAPAFELGNLTALIDRNHLTMDGFTEEELPLEPIEARFAAFGWRTLRIDGHDFDTIDAALHIATAADSASQPTVIIADTVKGRGVDFMENQPRWHYGALDSARTRDAHASLARLYSGVAHDTAPPERVTAPRSTHPRPARSVSTPTPPGTPDVSHADTGKVQGFTWTVEDENLILYNAIYGETLVEMGHADPSIVAVTADLGNSTRIRAFKEAFPERFFNVGVAEQNMIAAAAGLASCGLKPVVISYATFLTLRAAEFLRTDLAYNQRDVTLIGSLAGVAFGQGGPTHHAIEDLALLRAIPGMTVLTPADGFETAAALRVAITHPGPAYLRIGRAMDPTVYDTPDDVDFTLGQAVTLRDGHDVTIIACGVAVRHALEAAERVERDGISARVINVHTLKPLDTTTLLHAAHATRRIVTAEDHNTTGGLGSAVAEILATAGVGCALRRLGHPDRYAPMGIPEDLIHLAGFDADGIAHTIADLMHIPLSDLPGFDAGE